ncbi:MAG: type toxin-antitoxin system PemK/MazF family toxin [Rickettsiaceae bacterium]|jgi:mRNA interferase MazF|nr:type toxin-antitoxin system PemK/MazF family toxin [Rickettsiaceae bacterium]
MSYKKWDVVVVPFPFSDSSKMKPRPALVVSNANFNGRTNYSILAMITTASNTEWYNDVLITDLKISGLPVASVVRFKLFSLDNRVIIKKIGEVSRKDRESFQEALEKAL